MVKLTWVGDLNVNVSHLRTETSVTPAFYVWKMKEEFTSTSNIHFETKSQHRMPFYVRSVSLQATVHKIDFDILFHTAESM